MIRHRPTRITLAENDIADFLDRMLLQRTQFTEWHEQEPDQSDGENNETASVDSNSLSPYAFSHSSGSSCDREIDPQLNEGPSHGRWRRSHRHVPVFPSNEEHSPSPSAGSQWGQIAYRNSISQTTGGIVSKQNPLNSFRDCQSFANTGRPVSSGAKSLSTGIHWQASVKALWACCAEQLYHSLKVHPLFSALPRKSLTQWGNFINTAYERLKKFFATHENHAASNHTLYCHPQEITNSDVTLPAVFSAHSILAANEYHLEEGIPTGQALTLPESKSADTDIELQKKTKSSKRLESLVQSPDILLSICLDKSGRSEANPMTQPARKTLKITEGSRIDTSFTSHDKQVEALSRHRNDSDIESQVSDAEFPHKPHEMVTLDTSPKKSPGSESGGGDSTAIPRIIGIGDESNENDTDRKNDMCASSIGSDQRDASCIHSTTEHTTTPDPALRTTQVRDTAAEESGELVYSNQDKNQIGAMLCQEAEAALQDLAHRQREGALNAIRHLTVSTSQEQGRQESTGGPHGGRSEPTNNEREIFERFMQASAQFQNQVNNMLAELYHQPEDKADDFGLATLRRKPLGEWYRGSGT
ncbi:hypothetical protein ETB97_012487 [Aspergillus alliaceus]|uniref:Uncharacterized protein n=1 Tax=Petromyces alliaceus TaxID=209559 RepID=A0A8H6AD05_PETAA|nr:hypothetical protein ETB97_012487 [Aspergillus burnettii]